jgi:hypothetical protein
VFAYVLGTNLLGVLKAHEIDRYCLSAISLTTDFPITLLSASYRLEVLSPVACQASDCPATASDAFTIKRNSVFTIRRNAQSELGKGAAFHFI